MRGWPVLPTQYVSTGKEYLGREIMDMFRPFARSIVGCVLWMTCTCALAQVDPGVRSGLANTGGGLQQQGIPIPHPPLLTPNPKTGAPVSANERISFEEGI